MPKVTNHLFCHTSEDGERHWFDSEVFVDSGGMFSCTVPEALTTSLQRLKSGQQDTRKLKTTYRAYAPSLAELKDYVQRAMVDFHAVDSTSELVLCYSWFSEVSFFIRPDGSICENGSAPGAGYDAGGKWAETRTRKRVPIHATSCVDHYAVGLFAAAYRKTTFTRASGTTVKYTRLYGGSGELRDLPWAGRLSGFTGLVQPNEPHHLEQMPLSEEAAKFFFESMMAMCEVGRRFNTFFNDKEAVAKAIAGTGPSLLTHKDA